MRRCLSFEQNGAQIRPMGGPAATTALSGMSKTGSIAGIVEGSRSQSERDLVQMEAEREELLRSMDLRIQNLQQKASARCYDPDVSKITGFLIDLDGTMYQPGSLIPGASAFYDWLVSTGKPFVFLSNTGAKGSEGVAAKLASEPYKLSKPVRLVNAWTAAEAQLEYLCNALKPHAKVFAISGGSFWLNMLYCHLIINRCNTMRVSNYQY